jgi:Putative metallopeptidase
MKTFIISIISFICWIGTTGVFSYYLPEFSFSLNEKQPIQLYAEKKSKVTIPSIEYTFTWSFTNLYREYKNNRFMENIIGDIATIVQIPKWLVVKYDSCDEENAFYTSETHTITLCYELIDYYKKQIHDNSESFWTGALDDLLTEVVFHEFWHAIIDMYDLPITGKEEDVADQISAFLLIWERDDATIHAANSYYISAINDTSDKDDLPYWDEHSLDLQRYYNIMCWVYGSDTEHYSDFVTDRILPSDRAELCDWEYQKMNNSLIRLLGNKLNS